MTGSLNYSRIKKSSGYRIPYLAFGRANAGAGKSHEPRGFILKPIGENELRMAIGLAPNR